MVGAPTVSIRAASPTGEAVLFVKLYDVDEDGVATLSSGLVAPIRLTGLPADIADAQPVARDAAGDRPADRGRAHGCGSWWRPPTRRSPPRCSPPVYTVGLAGDATTVTLPTVPGEPIASPAVIWRYVLAALVAADRARAASSSCWSRGGGAAATTPRSIPSTRTRRWS